MIRIVTEEEKGLIALSANGCTWYSIDLQPHGRSWFCKFPWITSVELLL